MANSLPVLTVDIDDSKIKRLEEIARQFSDAFKTMPSGKVASNKKKEEAIYSSGSNSDAPKNNLPASSQKTGKTEVEKFFDNLGKSSKEANKSLRQLNKTLKETVNVTRSLFTTTLGWGVKLAAFGAIGTGGFGLIAKSAGNSLLAPQGRGISVAQQQAVNVAFGGRITGLNSLLDDLSEARNNVNSGTRKFLQSQGIDFTNGAFENLGPYLKAITKVASQSKSAGASLNSLQGMGANINSQNLNQIMALAKTGRLDALIGQSHTNANIFRNQLSDKTLSGFQDLTANFTKNAYQLSNTFLTTLSHISPGLQKFSDAITKGLSTFISGPNGKFLFEKIGQGFETLGKWLGSDRFQSDIKNFADAIREIAKAIYDSVKWIQGFLPSSKKIESKNNSSGSWESKFLEAGKAAVNFDWQKAKKLTGEALSLSAQQDLSFLRSFVPNAEGSILKPSGHPVFEKLHKQLVKVESSNNPAAFNAVSGATGYGQIIKSTADLHGFDWNLIQNDPKYNLWASKKILWDNLKQHHGDYAKALAQYNGGSKAVKGNDLNIKPETINYLHKILSAVPEAANQHHNLLRELNQLQIESNRKGNENRRFTIHLEEKAGSDFNLALQSQGQIPG